MKFKTTLAALGVAASMVLAAGAASASTIQFNLWGSTSTNKTSFSYTVGDVDLTITGFSCGDNNGPNHSSCESEKIDRWNTGIGMHRGGSDSHQVDGRGRNEFLRLDFSPSITLKKLQFTYADKWDQFSFFTMGVSGWTYVGNGYACQSGVNCGNTSTAHWFTFSGTYSGTSFLVGAKGKYDDWKLRGVKVYYEEPEVIPLPAAGWLLLGGLGGLAAMKRRRKAA